MTSAHIVAADRIRMMDAGLREPANRWRGRAA